jgi:hypothetical protein
MLTGTNSDGYVLPSESAGPALFISPHMGYHLKQGFCEYTPQDSPPEQSGSVAIVTPPLDRGSYLRVLFSKVSNTFVSKSHGRHVARENKIEDILETQTL